MNDLTLTKRCQCHEEKSQKDVHTHTQRAERQKLVTEGMHWGQGLVAFGGY